MMIQQHTLQFLSNLTENNHKEWFQANKTAYQAARENFLKVTQQLIEGIHRFDEGIAQSQLEAPKCMMRINRDIRFSKDKSPYKTHFFAYINSGGKKNLTAGYFISVNPQASFIGGGMYMPDNKILAKLRNALANNWETWQDIIAHPTFKETFQEIKTPDKLKRAPKGYDESHPAIEYLRFKGYYTQKMLGQSEVTSANLVSSSLAVFKTTHPLVSFLNEALT